jgi:hypothetical protein
MAGELENFLAEYDDATSDVLGSKSATVDTNLERWFEVLDERLAISKITNDLEHRVDFKDWYAKEQARNTGVGGDLHWPSGRENRLAMQLLSFRAMRREEPDLLNFHSQFMASSSNRLDDIVYEVLSQVFSPMARDLRKYIERAYDRVSDVELMAAPASDRAVPITHNSDYAEAIEQLDRLEELILTTNDFPDVEDRDQRAAEISAMRRLLNATRVRVDALISLCYWGLKYVAKKFADVTIGKIASAVLTLIGKITGLW